MSVTIRAVGVRTTQRAIQVDYHGELHWLPKSQILLINGDANTDVHFFGNAYDDEFVISDWIAREKGFVLSEETFQATDTRQPIIGCMFFLVKHGNRTVCMTNDKQHADMIAAALNMTQGKL